MSALIFKKENELVTVENVTKENLSKLSRKAHLCISCQNGCPSKCPKIADCTKKNIEDYKRIVDGYQIYGESGKLIKFVVSNCNKYVADENKKLTTEQLNYYRQLRKMITTGYFGVETMEEARTLMREQKAKGLLLNKFNNQSRK